jgi:ABC-2 type transport system permease protein
VLGTGLSRVIEVGAENVDFRTFLFPGVLATSVMFTAVFSGVSVVWDREVGFLREMLVAPIRRTSILAGKCLGGAIVATVQAVVILALAGLAGVPYSPVLMLKLLGVLFLASLSITAFGLLLGARVANIQSVMPVIQTVITPMMFLSGALYPTAGLPTWLAFATKINPVTYAVNPMRHVVFSHLDLTPGAARVLDPQLTWNGWAVPFALQLVILAGLGLLTFAVAVKRFSKTD